MHAGCTREGLLETQVLTHLSHLPSNGQRKKPKSSTRPRNETSVLPTTIASAPRLFHQGITRLLSILSNTPRSSLPRDAQSRTIQRESRRASKSHVFRLIPILRSHLRDRLLRSRHAQRGKQVITECSDASTSVSEEARKEWEEGRTDGGTDAHTAH